MTESPTPAEHRESQYAERAQRWSGRVNATTADVVRTLTPGDALELGCGEGGDVISFVQKINNMGFTEAVEYLADRVGLQLRYTEGDGAPRHEPGLRMRVLEANQLAAEFFAAHLASPQQPFGKASLVPLPLLGIPGLTPASECADYYRDTRQFRPRRQPVL